MSKIDLKLIVKDKTAKIIGIIMRERNISFEDASRLWYNSKTKKVTLDTKEYCFVSVARCYEELERELDGDPMWMLNPFD